MQAAIGDMLVMHEGAKTGDRAGEIIALLKTLGAHPYVAVVRWVDDGYVGLVFPETATNLADTVQVCDSGP